MRPLLKNSILALAALTSPLLGCGGGGGDDSGSFSGAATVSLDVNPSTIDSGDRTLARIWVGDVNENGVALKIRYPAGLSYVFESAHLTVDEKEMSLKPRTNVLSPDEKSAYLVFYISQRLFRQEGQEYQGESGVVEFQLVGNSQVVNGLVEIDADVDNPDVADTIEFNVNKPEFAADSQADITVEVGD